MLAKLLFLSTFLFLSIVSPGQQINALKLKNKYYYSEKNKAVCDSSCTLINEICYDEPRTIDEEYCNTLSIIIADTSKLKSLKTIDVVKDSSIAKCRWRFQSVWAWEEQKSIITGKINIVSWNKGLLKIDFDIAVDEIWSKRKYIYKGTRIFELPGK